MKEFLYSNIKLVNNQLTWIIKTRTKKNYNAISIISLETYILSWFSTK